MSVGEAVVQAIMLMLFVFIILIVLTGLISLFAKVLQHFAQKPATKPAEQLSPSPNQNRLSAQEKTSIESNPTYTGELVLRDVDDETAVLLMAIVSDESDIPLSELCFKSMRAITA